MQTKKLLILTVALCAVLAMAAFGSNDLKDLFNSQINPARAAGDAPQVAGIITVSNGAVDPNAQAVSAVQFLPAPELPTRMPDAAGMLSARDGNTLILQNFFMISASEEAEIVSGSGEISGLETLQIAPGDPAQTSVTIVSGATGEIASGSGGTLAEIPAGVEMVTLQSASVNDQGAQPQSGVLEAQPVEGGTVILMGPGMPAQAASQNVVVTDSTKIYRDVTPMGELPAEGVQSIQQVLETGLLEDLTGNVIVTVWGHVEGDQLVADVMLYQTPVEFN